MTIPKRRKRRRQQGATASDTSKTNAAQNPLTSEKHEPGKPTASDGAESVTPAQATSTPKRDETQPGWKTRVLKSAWTWIGAATAGAAGTVLAAVVPSAHTSAISAPVPSSSAPITALIDTTGSVPCGAPQAVVSTPGPAGKSIYGDYGGQPPSSGWLNVLVQGDGGSPVTIESVTAKVISRQPEKPGTVLESYCQGSTPSRTYIRLDLRASKPSAVSIPEPDPTTQGTVIPLPVEVTGGSPEQFYIQPLSGGETVRWSLQIHWERGNRSGTLTAAVNDGGSGTSTIITTVGTDGDTVLCPDGGGNTYHSC